MTKKHKIDEEDIQEFMDMLTGKELPVGMIMNEQPKLSDQAAWGVVWYLQEHLNILPSNFEMCAYCESVFDSEYGGHIISDEYDDWYQEMGIVEETVVANVGKSFCCEMCEYAFLSDAQKESEQ